MHVDWLTEWGMLRACPDFMLARLHFLLVCAWNTLSSSLYPANTLSLSLPLPLPLSLSLERKREGERPRGWQREREREWERGRKRKRERRRETNMEGERERERESEKEGERMRERERERKRDVEFGYWIQGCLGTFSYFILYAHNTFVTLCLPTCLPA